MHRETILDEAKKTITEVKVDQYGMPENNFQKIADMWNAYLDSYSGASESRELSAKDVANMMVLLKIARAQNGDKADTYVDMIGYAAIAYELMVQENPELQIGKKGLTPEDVIYTIASDVLPNTKRGEQ